MRHFLCIILSIQAAILGISSLNDFGLHIPIIKQIIGFTYLTIVPGILLMNMLRFKNLSNYEFFLYSIGLSLATLMAIGVMANFLFPLAGISNPISEKYLLSILTTVVLLLCFINYITQSSYPSFYMIHFQDIFSPVTLFLLIIPFVSIFGTYFVNFHRTNIILMALFLIIGLIPFLVAFNIIKEHFYPLAIYVISLTLLYHYSLISNYICGYDIHHEYYVSSLVLKNSFWNPHISSNTNSMLSVVMLAPIYSNICSMSLTSVFKIVYPLIYSLVPFTMYYIFKKQIDAKSSFYSCFFFISIFVFYTEMLALARQQIAELFLVLIILLISSHNDRSSISKSTLLLIFLFSLSVSHYALSYIFMFQLGLLYIILYIGSYRSKSYTKYTSSSSFLLVYGVFTLSWYIYFSNSSTFISILTIANNIYSHILTEMFNPNYVEGARIIVSNPVSPLHSILKYLHLASQLFISIGIFFSFFKDKIFTFKKEFAYLCYLSYFICLLAIIVPSFSSSLNTSRLYHICLIFLSPFLILGFLVAITKAQKYLSMGNLVSRKCFSLLIPIFLATFILFNSGWVYEVADDNPRSISLSQNSILNSKNIEDIKTFYVEGGFTSEYSVFGAEWLSKVREEKYSVYSDYLHKSHVLQSYGGLSNINEIIYNSKIPNNSYVYIGYFNLQYFIYSSSRDRKYWELDDFLANNNLNHLYSNGGCGIFSR